MGLKIAGGKGKGYEEISPGRLREGQLLVKNHESGKKQQQV